MPALWSREAAGVINLSITGGNSHWHNGETLLLTMRNVMEFISTIIMEHGTRNK